MHELWGYPHALKRVVAGGLTAVDMKNFPCDEFRSVEVNHRVNDIRDFPHSAHRMQRCHRLMSLDRMHRGFDNAWRNGIYAQIIFRVFDRQ